MGVLDGQAISASVTNAAFLNKNQADQMTFPVSFTKTLSLSKRDESSAATINALDTSQTLINITGTVVTINGAVAPATYADGATLVIANSSGSSVIINHESGSATAANRFTLPSSSPITLEPQQAAQFYYNSSSSRWKQMSGTGSGSGSAGINYITNPNAVAGTTGWATYADAAGAQPVDGTGGSPSVTWTASTTTPLRGTADFNFVKDAVNRQGEGVATDITIDNADLARVLTVSFDYEVLSGTYATGDLTVYLIQDPTGTPVVIQPAGFQVVAATAGTKMTQIATFQTDVAQKSYRLCFHVATTSALDYTLALDNIVLGPTQKVYGAPVTDWQSFTSPPTGTWIANTTYTGKYRRVGDSAEIDIALTLSGAPTSTGLSVNFLPPGLTLDTTKIALNGSFARFGVGNAKAGVTGYNIIPVWGGTSSVVLTYQSATTGAETQVTQALPVTWANGDNIQFTVKVPILGWSSNVEVSSSTDTRVVAARYARSASSAANALVANSYTRVNFDVLTSGGYDTHNAVTTGASWVFTAPVPGQYKISGILSLATAGANGDRILRITGAGVGVYRSLINVPTFGVQISFPISTEVFLSAGQTIFAEAFIPTSATDTIINETDRTHITIERLSGPSQIAASESVVEIRKNEAGSTIGTGTTVIPYPSVVKSTHGGWDSVNHRWTASIPGTYLACIAYQHLASGLTRPMEVGIRKNLTVEVNWANKTSTAATTDGSYGDRNEATISILVPMLAGDYLDFVAISPNGAVNLNSTNTNKIFIVRVGN